MAAGALLFVLLAAAGCGGGGYEEGVSPVIESVSVQTYNEGTDGTQYAEVTLSYDREINVRDGYAPKIRIADENVKKEDIAVSQEGSSCVIRIHIDKIRDGDMQITLGDKDKGITAEITDASGEHAAKAQTVKALIPSGVALEDAPQDGGGAAVNVTHVFNVRCIAWVLFTDGGQPAGGSLLGGADELDGAVGMHGHEFLSEDAYDVAADLADVLTNHFGDRYTFAAEGTTVTAAKPGDPDAALAIRLYTYTEID